MTAATKSRFEELLQELLFDRSKSTASSSSFPTEIRTKSARQSRQIVPRKQPSNAHSRSCLSTAKNNKKRNGFVEQNAEIPTATRSADEDEQADCSFESEIKRKLRHSRHGLNKRTTDHSEFSEEKEDEVGQSGDQTAQQTNERLLHQHLLQQQQTQQPPSAQGRGDQGQSGVVHRDSAFPYVAAGFPNFPLVGAAEAAAAAAVSQLRNASGAAAALESGSMESYSLSQQLHQATSGASYIYETNYSSPQYYQHYQPVQPQSPVAQSGYVPLHTQQSSPISVDDDGGPNNSIGNTARTPVATLEWLNQNYEPYESASLPRCTLYDHYMIHCRETGLEPVNAASFGKLIRSVFKGLRTRRLGTRGNSKYHYHGIRIKPSSRLLHAVSASEFSRMNGGNAPPPRPKRRVTQRYSSNRSSSSASSSSYHQKNDHNAAVYAPRSNGHLNENTAGPFEDALTLAQQDADLIRSPSEQEFESQTSREQEIAVEENVEQYVFGDVQLTQVSIDNVGELEEVLESMGFSVQHLIEFVDQYNTNCAELFAAIKSQRFDLLKSIWEAFWQNRTIDSDNQSGIQLDDAQIRRLCSLEQVEKFVVRADLNLYQAVLDFLIPNIFSKTMQHILERLRHFGRTAEIDLQQALQKAPESIQRCKLQLIGVLQYCLKQFIKLNHMSGTVRKYLGSEKCMAEMRADYCKIIDDVLAEAFWVTDASQEFVLNVHEDFKRRLQHVSSLDDWIQWVEGILTSAMIKSEDQTFEVQVKHSKKFLLQWNYFTDTIVSVLTAKSSVSFAHFHLLRLLYKDYLSFLVQRRLAATSDQSVMHLIYAHFPIAAFKTERRASVELDSNAAFDVNSDLRYYVVDQAAEIDQAMDMMCQNNNGGYMHQSHEDYLNADQPDNPIEPVLFLEEEGCPSTEDGASYVELRSMVEPAVSAANSTENGENSTDSKRMISQL